MQECSSLGPTLGRCAHLARERMDARLSRYDVTPAQTHVLICLHRSGGQMPQRQLTEYLKVKPSTANGILDRMAEKGLVERSVSGGDARQKLITLTEKGRAQQALFRENFQAVEDLMVQNLTAEEQAGLRELLGRVIQNLEEDRTT